MCYTNNLEGTDAVKRSIKMAVSALLLSVLLCGCALRTVDEMYSPPRRSAEYEELQKAIDAAMPGLEYCAPLSGENQQTVQAADLDGDGENEYLLFAKSADEKPLRILIFGRTEEGYALRETIESQGAAFERVEYVELDDRPGVELVVGRQVSDQVLRSLSVYRFTDSHAEQLMTASYSKFVTPDLDGDGKAEVLVISPGSTETDNAVAVLFHCQDGEMNRSAEVDLSEPADRIKRIMVGKLHGGVSAVYVASSVEESAIITDVFALKNGKFTNVSFSNESGTSVKTLRNYYVYADDIDGDGVLELPSLITMVPLQTQRSASMQYLIRWYAMTIDGEEVDKLYTFHNFDSGWYLQLDSAWASRLTVTQEGSACTFYMWDASFEENQQILTVYALTGSDRESAAAEDGRFVLYRGESVVYAAKLEVAAAAFGITQENLKTCFHLIHLDWNTGET